MRYFNYFIDQTISRITKNPSLRGAARSIRNVLRGTGKCGIGVAKFGGSFLLNPTVMGIGAAIFGFYMVFTSFGTVSTTLTNMASSSSIFTSSFESTTSMIPLVMVLIMGIVGMAAMFSVLGVLSGDRYGGAL